MARAILKSALILCNVPTVKAEAARRFYNSLLGSDDFVQTPNDQVKSYYRPLSSDGIDLTITQRQDDREQTTCYFAVKNLQQAIDELQRLGGTVVTPAREVRIASGEVAQSYVTQKQREGVQASEQVGRMAVLLDPDGNHVGLMELAEHTHKHFRWGKSQRGLDKDQLDELEQLKRLRPRRPLEEGGEREGDEEEAPEQEETGGDYIRGIGTQLHRLIDQLVALKSDTEEGAGDDSYDTESAADESAQAEQREEQRPMGARTSQPKTRQQEQRPRRSQQ